MGTSRAHTAHRYAPFCRALLATFLVLVFTALSRAPVASSQSSIALTPVFTGLAQPLFVTHAGDGTNRQFVVVRGGWISVAVGGVLQPTPFLDISSLVETAGFEQGLLGLAFHPNFASNGLFYIYYTARNWDNVVARYQVSSDPNRANPNGTVLLAIPDRFSNHNGGMLAFGPDGYLYIGTGDGGSGGDPDNNAQNPGSLLGKLLRINVNAGSPYAIPSSNPFVGTPGARGEIWALGLRNPWRFGFDRATGDLFIADVGQESWEEINFQAAASAGGENYEWRCREGRHPFNTATTCDVGRLTAPVFEYGRSGGDCSVTGGYVYRGARVPSLVGAYLYGDFCTGRIWALRSGGGGVWSSGLVLDTSLQISSFGEDEAGEQYVVDFAGGVVYRITDPAAPTNTPTSTRTPGPSATSTRTATPTSTAAATLTSTPVRTATPTPQGPMADLIITSLTANGTTADQPSTVNATVQNQGTAATGVDFHVHVHDGQTGPMVAHLVFAALAAGASQSVSGQIAAGSLSPGTHTLFGLADGHGVVTESNEGNNTRTTSLAVGAPPTSTSTPAMPTATSTPPPASATPTRTSTPQPAATNCPCTIWANSAAPATANIFDPNPVEVGVKFRSDVSGSITGVRFYKGAGNDGTHVGNLWSSTGARLASATFIKETASGWQEMTFSSPVPIAANTTYVASYHTASGYARDRPFFTSGVDRPPLHALASGASGGNGVYAYGAQSSFPTSTVNSTNYWVDVTFIAAGPTATPVPITTATPRPTDTPTATRVPSTATVTPRATDTPTATRIPSTATATPRATDAPAPSPTVGGAATNCPCTIWSSSAAPVTAKHFDPNPVEVGVKFRSDVSGFITGVRFYKGAGNDGTHVGNLWSSTGVRLASAAFVNETASGWQEVTFSSPVPIAANTTYVASYHTSGGYARDRPFFTSGVDRPPLHALASGASGGNGVYTYGAQSSFPTSTVNSTNYWVDVVFRQ